MNPNLVRTIVAFGIGVLFAILIGVSIATADYGVVVTAVGFSIVIAVLVSPGYIGLLAFGLLSPFALPIPFIYQLPFLLFVLGVCIFKYIVRSWLFQRPQQRPLIAISLPVGVLFAWILLRYCMDPVLPNVRGFGKDVTGFRSYLNYGMCFTIVLFLGYFIKKRQDYLRLVRWMMWISLSFVILLTPLVFTKSTEVAYVLGHLGIYVTTFDNGFLRFVVLPVFGLILLSVALLPRMMPVSKVTRYILLASGITAVVLGGNRSSVLMAFAIFCGIAFLKKRFLRLSGVVVGIAIILILFNVIGERLSNSANEVGFLRILALANNSIAEKTDAKYNVFWRKLRWERAIEEIRKNPVLGKGYGGLQNAFIWADIHQYEQASIEVDVASGGVHNGYLACALALGIPALLLLLFILAWNILLTGRKAWRHSTEDPVLSELLVFVSVNLIAFSLTIFIGTDVNNPMLWFYLASGVLLSKIKMRETQQTNAVLPQPEVQFSEGPIRVGMA